MVCGSAVGREIPVKIVRKRRNFFEIPRVHVAAV